MSNIRKKSIELIREIDSICRQENLKYALGQKSILAFDNHVNTINYDIIMPVGDMQKLITYLDANPKPDRALDYMKTNENYIGYSVCYVDTSTTAIDLRRGWDFKYSGIKIIIKPYRQENGSIFNKLSAVLETGWECNGYRLTRKIRKKRMVSIAMVRLMMTINRKKTADFIYDRITKSSLRGDNYYLKAGKRKRRYFEENYFLDTELQNVDENSFVVFKKKDEFLTALYGPNYMLKVERILRYKDFLIVEDTPYTEVIRQLENQGLDVDAYYKTQRRNLIKGGIALRPFKRRKRALLIARRSGDRLNFYEQLMPQRDEILELYKKEDYEKLSEIFMEHEQKTLYYLKRGLGFCVNREFFEIQCSLFRYEGREELIDKLIKRIPEEHYESII